jgi:acyl-coenzyme A thioesterase PaaI-like protein
MAQDDDWQLLDYRGTGTWPEAWPPVAWRFESPTVVQFRVTAGSAHRNNVGTVHGAFLAALAENSMQLPMETRARGSITISLAYDYPAPATLDQEISGEVRVVRETGRLVFVTIDLFQGAECVLHGTGVLRKLPPQ